MAFNVIRGPNKFGRGIVSVYLDLFAGVIYARGHSFRFAMEIFRYRGSRSSGAEARNYRESVICCALLGPGPGLEAFMTQNLHFFVYLTLFTGQ